MCEHAMCEECSEAELAPYVAARNTLGDASDVLLWCSDRELPLAAVLMMVSGFVTEGELVLARFGGGVAATPVAALVALQRAPSSRQATTYAPRGHQPPAAVGLS